MEYKTIFLFLGQSFFEHCVQRAAEIAAKRTGRRNYWLAQVMRATQVTVSAAMLSSGVPGANG